MTFSECVRCQPQYLWQTFFYFFLAGDLLIATGCVPLPALRIKMPHRWAFHRHTHSHTCGGTGIVAGWRAVEAFASIYCRIRQMFAQPVEALIVYWLCSSTFHSAKSNLCIRNAISGYCNYTHGIRIYVWVCMYMRWCVYKEASQ